MLKKFLFVFLMACVFALAACAGETGNGDPANGYENGEGYAAEENGDNGENGEAPAPTPAPTPEPTPCPTTVPTEAEGSISLRVETLGGVQWDGARIPVTALGLQPGNIYEFSMEYFTPVTQGELSNALLIQTSGPLWRHIAPTPIIAADADMEWHTLTGILDLTEVAAPLPEHIQIVKLTNNPNADANVIFFIDNFTVTRDGEEIAHFNFENDRTGPFEQSGAAIVTTGVAVDDGTRFPVSEWDLTLPSLAERWQDYFILGNILEPPLINNNPHGVVEMFLHHYRSVTAENAMKIDQISGGGNQRTRPAQLNLGGASVMVDFAEQHGLYMVGHTLVWHSQSAPWLYRSEQTGEYLTRAEAKENMRWFIEHYAGYFGDRIDAWDVTNEVFTDGGGGNQQAFSPEGSPIYPPGTWQRALRNNVPWYRAFANGADFEAGERAYDYIYYAFVFARRYAPTALLIYNDFNEEAPLKRNAMATMVEDLNERWHNDSVNNPAYGNPNHSDYGRLLIEVIGMQGHYNHGTNFDHIRASIERFIETGARIHVTELDIHFRGVVPADFYMTQAQMERQAEMYAQLFKWYVEFSDYIDRVTIWGREDGTSWRGDGSPTHFDRFFRPKPAFWAMYDPEGWRDRI